MKNKVVKIMISIVIVLIILTVGLFIYKQIDTRNKEKRKVEKEIVKNYQTFREKVEDFNEERKIYVNQVESDLFVESSYKYPEWITEIDKYTEKVDIIDKNSDYLKEKCINHLYSNQDIKNKCEAFIIAYETAFNYYVKDIMLFNESIEEFNKEDLEQYELKYDYVDINKDGNFFGKK